MSEDPGTTRMPAPAVPDANETAPVAEPKPEAQADSPGSAMLVVNRGPRAGQQIHLNRSHLKLGRSATCDIVLDDATVSRQHAEINRESGQYVVTDAGSLNGTYVNRSLVDRSAVLNDGDELRIGIFRLIFRA
ncbi:MAG: FHA domain-containing protein [Actinophytocola sp.]|nr:FHA domain-containing protein [Actinophytocola sp.]